VAREYNKQQSPSTPEKMKYSARIIKKKSWPIAYKTVRWHRMDILRKNKEEFLEHGKQYVYLEDTTGKNHSIQDFINRSIESIKKEKSKGKLRSVHSIAVIFDPHGKDEIEVIPV
jgi:hypothetical protein